MAKVLRGSSRQAWAFMCENWLGLAKLSLIPVLFLLASIWLTAHSQFTPADAIANGFIGLVAFLISFWLFALIVRFTQTRKATWLAQDWQRSKAILMTIVYATGIFAVVLLAGLAISLSAVVVTSALLDYARSHDLQGSLALLGIGFGLIQLGLQYWLLLRLLAGLPAVSFGRHPNVFYDFWPLAQGESWGLPLRLFLPWLVATILMLAILYPALVAITIPGMLSGSSGWTTALLMTAESSGWLPYFAAALIILLVPLFWFFTLLLTTAYHRFSQRQQQR